MLLKEKVKITVEVKPEVTAEDVAGLSSSTPTKGRKRAPAKKKVKQDSYKITEIPLERVGDVLHITKDDHVYKIPYSHISVAQVIFNDKAFSKYDGGELIWEGRTIYEDNGYTSDYMMENVLALTQFL